MKKIKMFLSFLIIVILGSNSYSCERTKLRPQYTLLCPDTSGIGWGHCQMKLRFNYATCSFCEFLSLYEWWRKEKLMWGVEYEIGLGRKSLVGFNIGGGSVKERYSDEEKSIYGLDLFYKICFGKECSLLKGGVVFSAHPIFTPPVIFPLPVVDVFVSYHDENLFSWMFGVRCQPVVGNGVAFCFPAGFFSGFFLNYKRVVLSVESRYSTPSFRTPIEMRGILLVGIGVHVSHQLLLGLKYVKYGGIHYDYNGRGGEVSYLSILIDCVWI